MTRPFIYRDGQLMADGVLLSAVAAEFGTPCYVYSASGIEAAVSALTQALNRDGVKHRICYAVKANSNLAILQLLARLGCDFDVVSLGELKRVIKAGGDAKGVVFSGIGKGRDEIETAIALDLGCINVESESELLQIRDIAQRLARRIGVSMRVNPDVDANTHPYIATGLRENKFGIAIETARRLARDLLNDPWLRLQGIGCHIGSQILDITPLRSAFGQVAQLSDELENFGHVFTQIDFGGGLGIRYRDEKTIPLADYGAALADVAKSRRHLTLLLEPGRSIVGAAGVLLTRIEHTKSHADSDRHFAIVDAAMNDLIRPALYSAWQEVLRTDTTAPGQNANWQIVGPVCESGDFLAKDRQLSLTAGQLLAVMDAGAYGFVMSSNYNTRPRAAEVLLQQGRAHLVRARETFADLIANERLLDLDPAE